MHSRLLRCILLGFTCLWFGMLVPMHQRGQIQLPGSEREQASAAGGCCQKAAKPSCHAGKSPKGGKPAPNPGNCAVCHFIIGLHAPPPVTFVETRHGLLELARAEEPATIVARHAALPFHGLDPPAV
jgi:hypothetical protein